jgi:hypothetical protein
MNRTQNITALVGGKKLKLKPEFGLPIKDENG